MKFSLRHESTNKAIVYSISMSLIAKILTFMQSIVISLQFGTQKSTDILFYAVSLVIMLTSFSNAINQQVLIPAAIKLRTLSSEDDSKKFLSFVYLVYLTAGLIIVSLLFFFPDSFFRLLSKFNISDIKYNITIIKFIIPTFLLILINTYILDIFTSYKYFTVPMLLDIIKSSTIILFVIIFKKSYSVAALAAGIFFANLLMFIILNVFLFAIIKCTFSIKYYPIDKTVSKNIAFVVTGQGVAFLSGLVIMYLISGFQTGIYTSIEYSQKINSLISSVVIGQLSTVVGINIIELFSKKDYTKLSDVFSRYLRSGLFILMPICFILSLNSRQIISILFERGEFTRESVSLTAGFFFYFVLMIPFHLIDAFLIRLIIAKQIQRISFLWQIFYNVLSIPLVWLLIKKIGYLGYPIGELAATIIYIFLFMRILISNQFKYIESWPLIRFTFFNTIINAMIMGLIFFTISKLVPGTSFLTNILSVIVSGLSYLILYTAFSWLYKENREIIKQLIKDACKTINKISLFNRKKSTTGGSDG